MAQMPSSASITGQNTPLPSTTHSKSKKSKSLNGTLKNTWNSLSPKKYALKTQPPALRHMARNFSNKFSAIQISMPNIETCSKLACTTCKLKLQAYQSFTHSTGNLSKI